MDTVLVSLTDIRTTTRRGMDDSWISLVNCLLDYTNHLSNLLTFIPKVPNRYKEDLQLGAWGTL